MPVYKRQKGAIGYFSTSAVDADAELDAKLKNIAKGLELGVLSPEEASDKRAALQQVPTDAEELPSKAESLEDITAAYGLISPIARDLRSSQIEMTVTLLAQDGIEISSKELRRLTGESPAIVRRWCDEPAPKGAGMKKSGKIRSELPTSVVRRLDEVVAEASATAPSNRGTTKS